MSENIKDWDVIQTMHIYGGSFAQAWATAFEKGDLHNQRKLKTAFQEMWGEYLLMTQNRKKREAEEA